jgi:gluconolactonase
MSRLRRFVVALLFPAAAAAADTYPTPVEALPDAAVQPGEVLQREFNDSRIFPGTARKYWIYVPAQYRGDQPACLYVGQDGIGPAGAVNIFDHLIAARQMPMTIAVFVAPGVVPARPSTPALPRFDRSYEYDSLSDEYVRFLIEELLPAASAQRTADGRPIRLSERSCDRAIGGSSSGAIAAFTAAWERPDSFSRVYSSVGTFVSLRGGDHYYELIRKTEPKAIRVFLQDGSADQNIYGGDWWMANQTMERALDFAGYEVNHVWGEGGHNGRQSAAIFPAAMRWLWAGWPQPVKKPRSRNQVLGEILLPGAEWELAGSGYKTSDGLAVGPSGKVVFDDGPAGNIYTLSGPAPTRWKSGSSRRAGQAFGPDGALYGFEGAEALGIITPDGFRVVASGLNRANDLTVGHNGNIYVSSDPPAGSASAEGSRIWLVRPDGTKEVVDTGLKFANGVALSPDQTVLYVDDSRSHWVYSFIVAPDGTLRHKQRFYALIQAESDDDTAADGMTVDRAGRLYVTTRLGIQVCDQAGRVNAILPVPHQKPSSVVLGGPGFDVLYAACGSQVYRRRLAVKGAPAWDLPSLPPKPKL